MNTELSQAIHRLLRPLIRILLRNGVPFCSFAELVRCVYVDVAMSDFAIQGRKPSDSRASVLTGLSRKEVRRLRELDLANDDRGAARYNRAARVLSAWVRDERYHDESGLPLPLELDSPPPSFASLVHTYSGDVPVRAVLDELHRVGAVVFDAAGRITLVARAYVPRSGEEEKLGILGFDVAELITTIDRNLQGNPEGPLFQRKVAYDNLPREAIEEFRALSRQKSQELLEEFDCYLAAKHRDLNPSTKGEGPWQAGVGIYYFDRDLGSQGNPNTHEGEAL